jgi:hypothetical protein
MKGSLRTAFYKMASEVSLFRQQSSVNRLRVKAHISVGLRIGVSGCISKYRPHRGGDELLPHCSPSTGHINIDSSRTSRTSPTATSPPTLRSLTTHCWLHLALSGSNIRPLAGPLACTLPGPCSSTSAFTTDDADQDSTATGFFMHVCMSPPYMEAAGR